MVLPGKEQTDGKDQKDDWLSHGGLPAAAVAAFFLPGAVGMALSVLAIAAAGGVVVLCAVGFARLLTRGAGAV